MPNPDPDSVTPAPISIAVPVSSAVAVSSQAPVSSAPHVSSVALASSAIPVSSAAPPSNAGPILQTPFQWFIEAYPFIDGTKKDAKRAHVDEFILLQKKINQGAKNRVSFVHYIPGTKKLKSR